MIKQKIKSITQKHILRFLYYTKRKSFRLTVFIVLKLANSKNGFLNSCVKKQVKKLIWLDTIEPISMFKESVSIDAYEPDYGSPGCFTIEIPQINLYKFKNSKVHGESSHIILDELIVMERLPLIPIEHCNYSTAFIKGHDSSFAMYGDKYETIEVDKAFFLGGNGSWNYYHWTLEIIAKLKYFLSSDISKTDVKIVLPDHARNIESFSIMLEIILKNAYEFVYISKNQIANIQEIYIITTPSNVVFNLARHKKIERNNFFYDKESIDFIRDSVINSSQYKKFLENISKEKIFKKIYFARKENSARGYNQNDVLNLLVNQGFKPVYLEELSFLQQVYLFQNVDCIVGASGAAWTNIIYLKPGSQGVSWLGNNVSLFSCYSTLAKYYDCNLKFFLCNVDDKSSTHSSYSVDLNVLLHKIL